MRDAVAVLHAPKHRIVYLCEERVVVPMVDATGRGKVRRFSDRNLFEFSAALLLLDAGISSGQARATLDVLRKFETKVRKQLAGFTLPAGIVGAGRPKLTAAIADGRYLSFVIDAGRGKALRSAVLDLRNSIPSGKTDGEAIANYLSVACRLYAKHGGKPNEHQSYFISTIIDFSNIAENILIGLGNRH